MQTRAGTVVGRGEGSPLYDPLYDPGSELYYWKGESSASITIMGWEKEKKWSVLMLL